VLGIDRQGGQDLILRRKSDLGGPDLHRGLGGIFTTSKAQKYTGSGEKPNSRFLRAIFHVSLLDQFETTSGTVLWYEESTMPAKLRSSIPRLGSLHPNCKSYAPKGVNRDCEDLLIFP